jgi:CheY-like chemotaxis protein
MAKTIVMIDDDVDFIEAMTTLLETKSYKVISANDGTEGFKKVLEVKPDLILLDVMMTSKTEGFEVARKLSGEDATKNIPVLLLTGIRKDMNLPFGFEANDDWLPVKGVIEKPVKPEELLSAVADAMA